jgi:HEAT repeat protein
LKESDDHLVAQALDALGAMKQEAKKAVGHIKDLLASDKTAVRAAAFALANIGADAREALTAVRTLLADREVSVRLVAAQAVYVIAGDLKQTVPVLMACLGDSDRGVRAAAVEVLGDMGPPVRDVDRKVVPRLVELVKDREDNVRRAAVEALKKIDPRAVPRLR